MKTFLVKLVEPTKKYHHKFVTEKELITFVKYQALDKMINKMQSFNIIGEGLQYLINERKIFRDILVNEFQYTSKNFSYKFDLNGRELINRILILNN